GSPAACDRILARRKPDVVLGGGGYVGGPMVVAAARRRIPCALMEADAHLGLANRLAAPFAKRVFLAFPISGRAGSKYRVTGRPIPSRSRPVPRDWARAELELPAEGPLLLVAGKPGRPRAERARRRELRGIRARRPPPLRRDAAPGAARTRVALRLQAAAVPRRLRA